MSTSSMHIKYFPVKKARISLVTRQIVQVAPSWFPSEMHLSFLKHAEITSLDNPVLTLPILSPRASSSCKQQ